MTNMVKHNPAQDKRRRALKRRKARPGIPRRPTPVRKNR